MFFRKRVVPKTPPSLEKLAAWLAGEMTGEASSRPMTDQVPELRKTGSASSAGTPTTAEAVSCVAGTMTCRPAAPVSAAISGRTGPSLAPASVRGPKSRSGRPRPAINSRSQSRTRGLYN